MSYLSFYSATYATGKSVGNPSACDYGNGLSDKAVKVIEIPSAYDGYDVVEIGCCSFWGTSVEKVFIPKTVRFIGNNAFRACSNLSEVRFEAGSMLMKISYNIFQYDNSLTKIDIPMMVNEIEYFTDNYVFLGVTSLTCFSYLGSTDFSTTSIFEWLNSPIVHVSDTSYPKNKQFGQKDVVRDGKTCGVSNDPFSKKKKTRNNCVCNAYRPNLTSMLIFLSSVVS